MLKLEDILDRMRDHQIKLGYPTPNALCKAAGLPKNYWSRWVRGTHFPSDATVNRVMAVKWGPGDSPLSCPDCQVIPCDFADKECNYHHTVFPRAAKEKVSPAPKGYWGNLG